MCPFHADFENVLNFITSYKTTQDIRETVDCFKNNSEIQIKFKLFLF